MGTLDNLFNKARDVANDMGKKANDVVEVSKLKLSVVSLGSDIDKAYQKLGLMTYEMEKSGTRNNELIDGCVAEIDSLKVKLDEVNEKVDGIRNVFRCESCGNAVDAGAQFCPMCGSLVRHPEEPKKDGDTIEADFTEVVNEATEQAADAADTAKDFAKEATEKVEDLAKEAEGFAGEAAEKVENLANDAEDMANEAVSEAANEIKKPD